MEVMDDLIAAVSREVHWQTERRKKEKRKRKSKMLSPLHRYFSEEILFLTEKLVSQSYFYMHVYKLQRYILIRI